VSDESLDQKLWEWKLLSDELKEKKAQEAKLRQELFAAFFSEPVEGTNTVDLPAGWQLKAKYTFNRNVDESALPAIMEELGYEVADDLVKFKPELKLKEYRQLNDEQRGQRDDDQRIGSGCHERGGLTGVLAGAEDDRLSNHGDDAGVDHEPNDPSGFTLLGVGDDRLVDLDDDEQQQRGIDKADNDKRISDVAGDRAFEYLQSEIEYPDTKQYDEYQRGSHLNVAEQFLADSQNSLVNRVGGRKRATNWI